MSTTPKHTAGPWKRSTLVAGAIVTDSEVQTDIALVTGRGAPEAEANARLIAAAPDLLDLARNVGGFDDGLLLSADLRSIRSAMREWRDQARAALAKVTP